MDEDQGSLELEGCHELLEFVPFRLFDPGYAANSTATHSQPDHHEFARQFVFGSSYDVWIGKYRIMGTIVYSIEISVSICVLIEIW